ncbi:MAG: citrate lyase holo-[acyl-carrier protein] synthase [Psittacicella sp.]
MNNLKLSFVELFLRDKETRSLYQKYLFKKYPNKTLISYSLNVPGEDKTESKFDKLFFLGISLIEQKLDNNNIKIIFKKDFSRLSGREYFLILDIDPYIIKKYMVEIEETNIGRLFDIDVLNSIKILSRIELGYAKRKCFLCSDDPLICRRSSKHSDKEIKSFIDSILQSI